MTVKVYKVEPKVDGGKYLLDVKDGGKPIDVTGITATTIVWWLDSDSGSFNAISSDSTSGFYWQPDGTTPSGPTFLGPTLDPGGQLITLTDTPGDTNQQTLYYTLNATIGTQQYSTIYSKDAATTDNPKIQNN